MKESKQISYGIFTLRRLLLIKQMYIQASIHRADGTDIASMMSCHHLDMCMELSLKTILVNLNPNCKIKGLNLIQLWGKTEEVFFEQYSYHLPFKTEILGLRILRNSVQHDGIIPSGSDLAQYETRVKSFLDEVLYQVFSLNLDGIYLSELINDVSIKQIMGEAEKFYNENKYDLSVEKSSVAFEIGKTQKLKEIKPSRFTGMWSHLVRYSTSSMDMNFGFRGGFGSGFHEFKEIERNLENMQNWISDLVNNLKRMGEQTSDELDLLKSINDVLMLGLNYIEYSHFKKVSFIVRRGANQVYNTYRDKDTVNTKEESQFCRNFVFNALLSWRL